MSEEEATASVESIESTPSAEGTESVSDSAGMWEDAQESFDEPSLEIPDEAAAPTPKTPEQIENLSLDALLNLDDLRVPHKYKPYVKERIERLQSLMKKESDASGKSVADMKSASQSLVKAFQNIAKDPAKLKEYVEQYGEQLGLDADTIGRYRDQNADDKPDTTNSFGESIHAVFNKYNDALMNTDNPQVFMQTLNQRDAEMINATKNEVLGMVKNILTGYHNQIVDPNIQTIQQYQERDRVVANAGSWNEAKENLSSKYQDFGQYEGQIKETLMKDPMFAPYRDALNKDAKSLAARGITHESVVETVYKLLARQEQPKVFQVPQTVAKPKISGLPPNSKRVDTRPVSHSDFNDLLKEARQEDWAE